nr:DUF1761 family protein [Devosia litorisediminis]
MTMSVNWIAVIVGAVLAFGLGSVWFSPMMFGKSWSRGVKMDAGAPTGMGPALVLQALGTFGFAWVVGITAAAGHLLTVLLIAASMALLQAGTAAFSQHGRGAVLAEAGYVITIAIIMIGVHAVL